MTDIIKTAEDILFNQSDVCQNSILESLKKLSAKNIDYGDIYCQKTINESWGIEEGIIKTGAFSIDQGVGVRAVSGEKTGFSYVDDLTNSSIISSAKTAREIINFGQEASIKGIKKNIIKPLYSCDNPLDEFTSLQKVQLLKDIDLYARSLDKNIIQVNANLSGEYDVVLIASTDGVYSADIRPLVRMNVSVVIEKNGKRESFHAGGGGRCGYDFFLNNSTWQEYVKRSILGANRNLAAVAAPAGSMPVILGSGWPAVLLHEAIGHGLEGDFNRKKTSHFSNLMGEKIASDICTVVDDGTLKDRRGSISIDDEGTPSQKNTLIENGRFVSYIKYNLTDILMKTKTTANCRRESYAHIPLPRMTNTYMLPGKSHIDEMISSVKKGIYAVNFNGGQVDITSGQFVFVTDEAYMVENGKITTPIKGATLVGSGPEVMQNITMVGDDFALDSGVGSCGKDGQTVPVGVGQPSLKISKITVGGTA
jgi:TldD protein